MNPLRNEITDAVIELVFVSFPTLDDKDFRAFVHQVLQIVDYAAREVVAEERRRRHATVHLRGRN